MVFRSNTYHYILVPNLWNQDYRGLMKKSCPRFFYGKYSCCTNLLASLRLPLLEAGFVLVVTSQKLHPKRKCYSFHFKRQVPSTDKNRITIPIMCWAVHDPGDHREILGPMCTPGTYGVHWLMALAGTGMGVLQEQRSLGNKT